MTYQEAIDLANKKLGPWRHYEIDRGEYKSNDWITREEVDAMAALATHRKNIAAYFGKSLVSEPVLDDFVAKMEAEEIKELEQ